METRQILAAIDEEIQRLQRARTVLSRSTEGKRGSGKPKGSLAVFKRRHMSPEGRARIAAAQRARWAKAKKAAK